MHNLPILPYKNLLDKHENVTTAVLDPLEVPPKGASLGFCLAGSKTRSEMIMSISDCNNYAIEMSIPECTDIHDRLAAGQTGSCGCHPSADSRGLSCCTVCDD